MSETRRIYCVDVLGQLPRLCGLNVKVRAKTAVGMRSSGLAFGCRHTFALEECDFTPEAAVARWRENLRSEADGLRKRLADIERRLAIEPEIVEVDDE